MSELNKRISEIASGYAVEAYLDAKTITETIIDGNSVGISAAHLRPGIASFDFDSKKCEKRGPT